MTDPNTSSSSPAPESLQFDQMDAGAQGSQASALQCARCRKPITTVYYHVDGSTLCESCKDIAARSNQPVKGARAFLKSLLFGGMAAIVGAAIYYAVIAITNFEIGIVAILIGFIVGAAVRRATAGGGGRRYQVLALVLTYFAVGLAYMPLAIKGAMDSSPDSGQIADSLGTAVADSASPRLADSTAVATLAGSASAAAPADSVSVTFKSALLSLVVVFAGGLLMTFALPVLAVFGSLPSGLISAFIIGIGMHQAWKMTAAQVASITGPYRVGGEPEVPAAPQQTG
jgi:hypothetical protein